MTTRIDTTHAAVVLRLLLDDPFLDPDEVDWTAARLAAERGAVLVRLSEAVRRRGEPPPRALAANAAEARGRAERLLPLVSRLGTACRDAGVPHVFLKVAERYPDMGSDIDLLVGTHDIRVDPLLLCQLPQPISPTPLKRGLRGRLTGAARYRIGDAVLDLHHGRLGAFGEQDCLPQLLLRRARSVACGESSCRAPSPEDNLLLLALHQVYTRPAFRLADVYWTVVTLRNGLALNWTYLETTAQHLGLQPALGEYLSYVDGIHRELFHRPLVPGNLLRRLAGRETGLDPAPVDLRFPQALQTGWVFLRQFQSALLAHDWASAARLSMLPIVALAAGFRTAPPRVVATATGGGARGT